MRIESIEFDKDNFDIDKFIKTARSYLYEGTSIPSIIAISSPNFIHDHLTIKAFFYDSLLKSLIEKKSKYKKDLYNLIRYGYIGGSNGGKNGLVLISRNPSSGDFKNVVERFNLEKYFSFCNKIGFKIEDLKPVKIVTHRSNGERIVGVLNRENMVAVLYEARTYGK